MTLVQTCPIARCFSSAVIRVMYLKKHKRKKNGKYNTCYSIVEKRKVSRGRYVEKRVLYIGEISDSQKKAWEKSIEIINENNKPVRKSLFAYDQDTDTCLDVDSCNTICAYCLSAIQPEIL